MLDSFIEKYKSVTNKETFKESAKELDEGGTAYVEKWWAKDPKRVNHKDAGKLADFFVSSARGENVSAEGIANTSFAKQIATEIKDGSAPWVEQMNSEIEAVEQIEQVVNDAVTKRYVSPAENSELQSSAEGDIIDNGDDGNGSEDTKLLAGRKVSTAGGSRDGIRQQSENSRKLTSFLGGVPIRGRGNSETGFRAGDSGWLVRQAEETGKENNRFTESIRGEISGTDTAGRKLSNEIKERFKNTVFKDKDGNLLSLYHWTKETFDRFAKGEFGFHLGTLDAAHDRYTQNLEDDPNTPIGNYKETYVNMEKPLYMDYDAGVWDAQVVALWLKNKGLITEAEYKTVKAKEGFYDNTYDNPAANTLRDMLKEMGYDGIVYPNASENEGSFSVIAFDADQILTVAENGVLKENNGVSEADFSESAFSMPESRELFTEEEQGNAQERVKGIAKYLDSDLKVLFVDSDSVQLKGAKGKFVRRTNTLFISKDASTAEMYVEVFKHEFVHRLETRRWYQSFKNYLYDKSSAFLKYARAQLKLINGTEFKGSREEALKALADYYYEQYTTDEDISAYIRNSFTVEDAQREIVADFAAEVLFKGEKYKKDMAFALAEETVLPTGDIESSIDALEELAQTDRNLFQKVWDTIKDLINALMGRPQTENITADLEYLENRLKQVYDSADTKKAAKKAGGEQYLIKKSTDGTKFVQVDKNTSNATSPKDIAKTLSNIVKNKFNDFVDISGQKIGINGRAVREWQHSKDAQYLLANEPQKYKDKINAFNNADELLKVARDYIGEEIKHLRKDNFVEFARGIVDFKVGDRGYSADIIVGTTKSNVALLYDIVGIQEKEIEDASHTVQDRRAETSSNDIIDENKSAVKNNISTESGNYSENDEGQRSVGSPMQKAKENFAKYERGEMTSEEYQESLDELWGEANEKYGSFPTGENAENAIAVPQAVSDDRNTRRFIRTILETGKLSEEMIEDVEQEVLLGDTMSYKVISDEKAIKKAA